MESFNEAKSFWQSATDQEGSTSTLNKDNLDKIIKLRARKEKGVIAAYFWTSLVYQIFIYSFLSHFIVRYWSDGPLVALSLAGIILYIPFTILFMKKYKAMLNPPVDIARDIQANIRNQYSLLSQFSRFKKRFDLIAIPVICFLITTFLIELYSEGGIKEHVAISVILFFIWITLFSIATWVENKKRFQQPLNQLGEILKDIGDNS